MSLPALNEALPAGSTSTVYQWAQTTGTVTSSGAVGTSTPGFVSAGNGSTAPGPGAVTTTPLSLQTSWAPDTGNNCTGGTCSPTVAALSNAIVSMADVTSPSGTTCNGFDNAAAYYSVKTYLCANTTYRLSYTYAAWGCGHRNATLRSAFIAPGGTTATATVVGTNAAGTRADDNDVTGGGCPATAQSTAKNGTNSTGTGGGTYLSGAAGVYTLEFRFLYGTCDICFPSSTNAFRQCAARTSQIGFSNVVLTC